jgi:hypothetical protein
MRIPEACHAPGPLNAGEEDRAAAWAAGLVLDAAIHRVG